jgi:hypothetical protein
MLKTEMRNDVVEGERRLFKLPGAALGFILAPATLCIEATRGREMQGLVSPIIAANHSRFQAAIEN